MGAGTERGDKNKFTEYIPAEFQLRLAEHCVEEFLLPDADGVPRLPRPESPIRALSKLVKLGGKFQRPAAEPGANDGADLN